VKNKQTCNYHNYCI